MKQNKKKTVIELGNALLVMVYFKLQTINQLYNVGQFISSGIRLQTVLISKFI